MTDLSPATRRMLTEGMRALHPSQAARDRIRAGVAARVSVAPGGGTGTAGAAGGVAGAIAKGSVIAIVTAALVGGAIWLVRRDRAPQPEPKASRVAVEPTRERAAAPLAAPPASPRPSATPVEAPASVDRRSPHGRAVRTDGQPPLSKRTRREGATSDLAREVQLLERARRALAQGDAEAARGVLADYRRDIAAPQMQREALLLQAEAECAGGRTDEGLQTLARVDDRWPGASGVSAVRALCTAAPR